MVMEATLVRRSAIELASGRDASFVSITAYSDSLLTAVTQAIFERLQLRLFLVSRSLFLVGFCPKSNSKASNKKQPA